jgi:hypothetical protein
VTSPRHTSAPRLITASRRTDVPAFYGPWLLRRIRAGYCHVLNPYNGTVGWVGLTPDEVAAIGLFTRDLRPMLPHLPGLLADGFRFYAHVTINAYPETIEPHVPGPGPVVHAVHELAALLGPAHVLWRYDPIVLCGATPAAWHRERFEELADALEGAVDGCYISFATWYAKTERRLGAAAAQEGWGLERPSEDEQRLLAAALLESATAHGLRLFSCAAAHLQDAGLERGRCADPLQVAALRPDLAVDFKAAPTRPGCGCCAATDIGAFDTCVYGCAYCYATRSQAAAVRRRREHDPADTILWRPPSLRGVDLDAVAAGPQRPPDLQPPLFA